MSRMCRKNCTEPAYLRNHSTDNLCAFYKNKLGRLEDKFAELWEMHERLHAVCKESSTLHSELQSRNSEVTRLQLSISDHQVFLFREREENLKLAAENDKLRIQEYENNRAIHVLLKLCGIKKSQLKDLMSTSGPSSSRTDKCSDRRSVEEDSEPTKDALMLEVKSLKTQLENLRTLFRNEVDVLLKDREVFAEERATETKRLHNHLTILANNLKNAHDCLKEASQRILQLEENDTFRGKKSARSFMDIPVCRDDRSSVLNAVGSSRSLILQTRLDDQEKLCSAYQQQCKHLEVELKRWKERAEEVEKLFKEKTHSLSADLTVMRHRYDELDRRRILEAEGFRTDIKLLRERIKELDKQILKLKNYGSPNQQAIDEDLKASTQMTLKRAQQFEKEVAALKLKVMTLARE